MCLLEAGKETYEYIRRGLLAEDEGLCTAMKIRFLTKVYCPELETTSAIDTEDRIKSILSRRFSFNLDADTATTELLKASNVSLRLFQEKKFKNLN